MGRCIIFKVIHLVKAMLTKKKLFLPAMFTLTVIAFWIRNPRCTTEFGKRNHGALPMATITGTDSGKKVATENLSRQFPELPLSKFKVNDAEWATFPEALASQASEDKLIILSIVDSVFLDMAANYYITSIHRHRLHHCFLFIALDGAVCHQLQESLQTLGRVPCFTYGNGTATKYESFVGSKDFHKKTNSRNRLILEALQLSYTVLNTDVDLYFVSNPLPDIISTCERSGSGCDVAPILDSPYWNPGFVYIRPTNLSVIMYSDMVARFQQEPKDELFILRDVIQDMKEKKLGLNLAGLDGNKFACGKSMFGYFTKPTPKEDINVSNHIVIHNNGLIGKDLKIIRFKEMAMWHFDEGQYYTNTYRKYLKLGNPTEMPEITKGLNSSLQWTAIRNGLAIASILDRILILPKVYKNGSEYSMAFFLTGSRMRLFEFFDVREETFLEHPLVPKQIKSNVTQPSIIANRLDPADDVILAGVTIHIPRDLDAGPTVQEIHKWYGKETARVLLISSMSMYRNFRHLNRTDMFGLNEYSFLERVM